VSTLSRLIGRRRRRRAAKAGGGPAGALEGLEQQLFEHCPVAAVITDPDDRIRAVNAAYSRLTGYRQEEVEGRDIGFNCATGAGGGLPRDLADEGRWMGEFQWRAKDGAVLPTRVTRLRLTTAAGELHGYLTLADDVAGDDARRSMLWQARYDPLTRLPNRHLLTQHLAALLARGSGAGALFSFDLDRFQIINDSVGPASADELLTEVAYRITLCLGSVSAAGHMLARVAGDQFLLLMSEARDRSDAERLAQRILESIRQPFHLQSQELFLTGSLGIAMIESDIDAGEVLQRADAARLHAKQQGGDGLAYFEHEMNDRAERRLALESALRRAIGNGELRLYYQPVVDVGRGVVVSAEALLRWQHPHLGLVPPGEFIPVAEEMGLIVEIGEWVVGECRRQLRRWREQTTGDVRISLNVSPVQLRREDDAQALLTLLRGDGEPGAGDGLIIELTESTLMENSDRVRDYLDQVRQVGSMVALDDFGTGYSSLACLRHIEFDVLKIDKTFIDGLDQARDYGLVASIVSMGRILGMRVVAEGVETAAQVEHLRQIGCDYIQGYYYSPPLPADDFHAFVTARTNAGAGTSASAPGNGAAS
jgi:diguanylate cyclase (GGDEF)-like protein/PAS domain S-box-containing protein